MNDGSVLCDDIVEDFIIRKDKDEVFHFPAGDKHEPAACSLQLTELSHYFGRNKTLVSKGTVVVRGKELITHSSVHVHTGIFDIGFEVVEIRFDVFPENRGQ